MNDECDSTPVACELRRLSDLLSEPDWFDWASGLVVPVTLGIATLLLAWFTITTARQANKLARQFETDRVAREERAARRAIVPDLDQWATLADIFDSDDHEGLPANPERGCASTSNGLGTRSLTRFPGHLE